MFNREQGYLKGENMIVTIKSFTTRFDLESCIRFVEEGNMVTINTDHIESTEKLFCANESAVVETKESKTFYGATKLTKVVTINKEPSVVLWETHMISGKIWLFKENLLETKGVL